MRIRKTTEEFISEVKAVHGDRYDYSLVHYLDEDSKINIICKQHGLFKQAPKNHKGGSGCPTCAGNVRKTTEKFIKDAKEVHADRYDYGLVEYVSNCTNVIIICRDHGKFPQTPFRHLNGCGCPACYGNERKTTEGFILDAIKIHGDKYDYSSTKYISKRVKLTIKCFIHGHFPQLPSQHLHGGGCPKCVVTGFNPSKSAVVYVYTFNNYAGFGITNNFKKRNAQHQRAFKKNNVVAKILNKYNMSGESAQSLEKYLKQTLPIINTGIDGFKTEAVHINDLPILLDTIKQYESI